MTMTDPPTDQFRPTTDVKLFAADLDGTLLGNPEASYRFTQAWDGLDRAHRPLLVYNTGRTVRDTLAITASRQLPQPDFIIGGVGTQLLDTSDERDLSDFEAQFADGWDLDQVERIVGALPGIEQQPAEFLHRYKSSWYWHRVEQARIHELQDLLDRAGLKTTVVYSSLRDLDVLPRAAAKGNALRWLAERLGISLREVLVTGDSGNDSSMFVLPEVNGIVVENAQPELFEAVVKLPVFVSRAILADGVIEGLRHFGVLPPERRARGQMPKDRAAARWKGVLFGPESLRTLSAEDRDLIALGYEKALEALRKNITPLGFSACSLDDNAVTGTDVNYRSVWARDGCFTVVQTIDMDDLDIREAQLRTLRTLLDATSPGGQVPANVRIETLKPDYSGVGGIASIDSGLWLVIAVYHYVTVTGDLDLLTEYGSTLERIMHWLGAHDSNGDGLLEVPEAGDWMDLFGRSYNVLYDEVLWYRANVCYGRLLEYQREYEQADEYLHRSQHIGSKIKTLFWPSTVHTEHHARLTFADRQSSLGDSPYLLAEITPFAFNWRCDVYANVLAFLMNLIEVDHARTAFRFMWGVGVSDPYPAVNLYPAVQSGDPDWRPYYTVNLMNLPHHYHNGGVWPFVGGLWVRFVHRLGLEDIARNELVKLAKVNQLGKSEPWEFNEWIHGQTGRPMGKAYQAWSAAAYLRACQELHMEGVEDLDGD